MAELDLTGQTIVVVDDEEFSRQIVADMLHGLGRPSVYRAANGKDALTKIHQLGVVDMVISDYRMPKLNGLQLLHMVRTGTAGVPRALPFAMLTGYGQARLVELALALDVNAFLVKRVSKAALTDRLTALMRVTGDGSWLKPAEVYRQVKVDFRKNLGQRPRQPDAPRLPLAEWSSNCLSVLSKKFTNSDLRTAIDKAALRLADTVGQNDAERIMTIFDMLERQEKLSVFDIAAVLVDQEDEMILDPDAQLQNDIKTVNGELLFRAGMPISSMNRAVISQLSQIGIVCLTEAEMDALNLEVITDATGGNTIFASDYSVRSVEPTQVSPGDTLARDIFTTQGMLYATSGETMSERSTALLVDLYDLEKFSRRSG